MVIGEILFDVINGRPLIGGAPFNFAFHLIRLGFDVAFISRIGDDALGREMRERLKALNFPAGFLQTDPEFPTGTVEVSLDAGGGHGFDIKKPAAYDRIAFIRDIHRPVLENTDLLYFGTLAQRTETGHAGIREFLRRLPPDRDVFYDINLRPGGWSGEVVARGLARATWLKLNTDELCAIREIFSFPGEDQAVIKNLREQFSLRQVLLTRGSRGSDLYEGDRLFREPAARVSALKDTVGAGDAFAALFCAGMLRGWEPAQTLGAASRFAAKICEIRGAIPEDPDFYTPFRRLLTTRTRP